MTRDELRERLAMTLAGLVVVKAPVTEMVDALFLGLQAAGMAVVPAEADEAMLRRAGDTFVDAAVGHIPGDIEGANTPFKRWYRAMLAAGDLLGGKNG